MQEATAKTIRPVGARVYRPELDVVRFAAFFLVFIHHAGYYYTYFFPRNNLVDVLVEISSDGLPLFFVLSAFLISDLLMREREAIGRIDVGAFYRRRILRIWPLYIVGLLLGIGYDRYFFHVSGVQYLVYFLLLGNVYCQRFGFNGNPAEVLWSISIEEQFYLFYPALAGRLNRRGLVVVCLALVAVANALLFYYGTIQLDSYNRTWCSSFVHFEMFAAGILLAITLKQRTPDLKLWLRFLLLLACPACWFATSLSANPVSSSGLMIRYGLAGFGCVAFLFGMLGMKSNYLPRWMVYSGRISYGLYVFHQFGLRIVSFIFNKYQITMAPPLLYGCWVIGGLACTYLLAALSYRFFESPFLKLKPERI